MTYHKQFSKSRLCTPALYGELCGWMHGLMQRDSGHSSSFVLHFDHSFDESSDIPDFPLVSKFCHYFGCCFLTIL